MTSFRILHSFLQVLSYHELKTEGGFERAFASLFDQDVQTFRDSMLLNLDQLQKQLDKDEFQEDRSMAAFWYDSKMNERQMQSKEGKVDSSKALDATLVVTECSAIELENRNYLTQAVDADIRPINDQVPIDEVQLTAQHNVLTNEQQHTEQSKPIYNTYLLEKVDSNTTLDSINMSYRGGEIDQDAEQYQINELKAQLQAKNSTINNLKKQNKNTHEKSDEAKVKHEIDVLEIINIELESSVSKLLVENEMLNKENEHLKQTYKELYDSIKNTRIQTKDHNDSLISQVNSKTVENVDLKAHVQEKVFANATLKSELRKLKGTSVDTKFAKPSILGKPVLQPHRHQSVVRQPIAFKSERSNFSKPWFASQVDVINDLTKPDTPHYLPKVREYVFIKPHHLIASGSSRNSSKESYGSNDMAHKYYLEVAKKKTQDKNTNLKPSVMHTISLQNTTNGSKLKPRSNNQTSKSLPVPKSSRGMLNGVPLVDHSRNSSSFLDSKHFVCSTCQKCVFNANHDDCITKFLKEVNYHAKIFKGYRFSPNKSFAVHEKPNTPRSCLMWKPTGRIFKNAGLRWIPTGKMFIDSSTKVDSEPPNGLNDDITNPYECDQTHTVSASTLNLSAGTSFTLIKESLRVWLPKRKISHKPGVQGILI
ncbi:hypothetical protein Tco_1553538 [Tanacetum coccineum]